MTGLRQKEEARLQGKGLLSTRQSPLWHEEMVLDGQLTGDREECSNFSKAALLERQKKKKNLGVRTWPGWTK